MEQKPLVSIIVPVYNCERFIRDTIQTVLNQTFQNWELLLINDCSKDGTCDIIRSIKDKRIRLIEYTPNRGAYFARNKGLELAAGQYIAYLDADDLWAPDKLEKQLNFMQHKHYGFTFTSYEFANEKGEGLGKIAHVPVSLTFHQALKDTIIFTSTVMFDQTKIEKDLFLMPHIESEDTATWWRVLKAGYSAFGLDEVLTLYRRSSHSLSSNKMRAIWRIWNLYRNGFELSIPYSCYNFVFYAFHTIWRRL